MFSFVYVLVAAALVLFLAGFLMRGEATVHSGVSVVAGAVLAILSISVATAGVNQFSSDDTVVSVVNGSLPKNLSENLTKYQISNDWSNASWRVDFSNASENVRVYVDGENALSQFDVRADKHKIVLTAKPEFLANTAGQSADRPVKLVIFGEFTTGYKIANLVVHAVLAVALMVFSLRCLVSAIRSPLNRQIETKEIEKARVTDNVE